MSARGDKLTAALGARYQVERELGTGATATVFLANDLRYQRQVAVKLFRPEVAEALGHERFVREIALAATLNHPHIVPLLDSGEVDGMMFYVMPAVEGETLRERLTQEGMLPIDDAIQVARDVAVALDYAHRRDVVHRDIKPENILLTAGTAVVTDFGIAKMLNTGSGGNSLTRPGFAVGTVTYMSPEQASLGEVDGRSDIYALACVLFEMLAGRPPFVGTTTRSVVTSHFTDPVPSLHHLRPDVAPPVEAVVARALAKNPDDRFPTATAFLDELAKARRTASRDRMWKQLGGTTPTPKSGEWRERQPITPSDAAGQDPISPPPQATPGPGAPRGATQLRIPAVTALSPDVGHRDGEPTPDSGASPSAPPPNAARTGRLIAIAAAVLIIGALAWMLGR